MTFLQYLMTKDKASLLGTIEQKISQKLKHFFVVVNYMILALKYIQGKTFRFHIQT